MDCARTRPAPRREADRLIYGSVGGRRRGPRRIALDVAAARLIDHILARSGAARPAVLVSGFWRSGTTWLQESLAAALGGKTIFEPLSPMDPDRRAALIGEAPDDGEDLRQATIPGPQPAGSPFWRDLDRACTGRRGSAYLLGCRQSVGESFRRLIVVKDVRLQANLAAFHRRYGAPVVHVRRHPCAVVASLRAAAWHWSFAQAMLAELLPRLLPALDAETRAVALRFDVDEPSRIAAFWAVTERLAAADLRDPAWGLVLSYERFVENPEATLADLCQRLGLRHRHAVDLAIPSASVDPQVFASYDQPPAERWRDRLTSTEIARIEKIADAIFPEWRTGASRP